MPRKALWAFGTVVGIAALTAGLAWAQDRDRVVKPADRDLAEEEPSKYTETPPLTSIGPTFPVPPGTVFQREEIVLGPGEAGGTTAGPGGLVLMYSNTLGGDGIPLGPFLGTDDIATVFTHNCRMRKFEFPVLGKVDPTQGGGAYTVKWSFYRNCPQAVPEIQRDALKIAGTTGTLSFPDDAPRTITVSLGGAGVAMPSNVWFGVSFNRGNAGVVGGSLSGTGMSCDQFDYVSSTACSSGLGGYPDHPMASFNLQMWADAGTCTDAFLGYKNNRPNGPPQNPGVDVYLVDDIQLGGETCEMIAYEVALLGQGFYTMEMRNGCESPPIPGTQQFFGNNNDTVVQTARFAFAQPITLQRDFFFAGMVNNSTASYVVTGQQACIGATLDSFDVAPQGGICNPVRGPDRSHAGLNLTITCAGKPPVGACCDMMTFECEGGPDDGKPCCPEDTDLPPYCLADPTLHDTYPACTAPGTCEAPCRRVPQMNCAFPPRFSALRPKWVEVAPKCDGGSRNGLSCAEDVDCPDGVCDVCNPEPFSFTCGISACCQPDDDCNNRTLADCNDQPPEDAERLWQRGKFCGSQGQTCPPNACLGRVGECTRGRCLTQAGVCNLTTHRCTAGTIGLACNSNSQCNCPGSSCQVNPTCCDSCPPTGCEDSQCCAIVCRDGGFGPDGAYCCHTEWDSICAGFARSGCNIPPSNDECPPLDRLQEGALLVAVPSITETDSVKATENVLDPGFGCYIPLPPPAPAPGEPGDQGLQTVWYKFFAPATGEVGVDTCLSNAPASDSLVSVYAVGDPSTPITQCATLIPIACNDNTTGCSSSGKNSRICLKTLTPGAIYYVLVSAKERETNDPTAYTLRLSTSCNPVPPVLSVNDFCTFATPITNGVTPFDLSTSSMEAPIESCIATMTTDLWYNYTATCTGELQVKTCGITPQAPDPDTNLVVYETCSCPSVAGVRLGCSTDAGGACGNASEIKGVDVILGNCYKIRLADSAESFPAGNLTVACVSAACPAGALTFVDPPDEVVDARRPHNRDDANLLFGIQTITAQHTSGALSSCFSLCETGNSGSPNSIQSVVENPPGTYTITLARPISPGEKTNIIYANSHVPPELITLRLVSSPGNIAGDAVSGPDVLDLVNALNGTQALMWGLFSGDVDGSSKITGADVVEAVDVLKGYGAYAVWDGTPNELNNAACLP